MEGNTDMKKYRLRKNSALFWLTLIVPIGIIGIGINFILNPVAASAGYGVPMNDPNSFPFMWIKGIRDIFAGLVVLPFLFRGDRTVTAILFAISIFVPLGDGFVIIGNSGFSAPLLIHWGTAFYMMVVSYFLMRKSKNAEEEEEKI